jgi:hypothetical protein
LSFLHGRYIPKFDPSKAELPTEEELDYYLYTHNIEQVPTCGLEENRYTLDEFYDKEDDKVYDRIYCWKGIIKQKFGSDCTVGSVCDPNSYVGARTRFCLTWGCPDPHLYVGDATGESIVNERGGITVFNPKANCEGAFINKMNCFIAGIRQSFDHMLSPENRKAFIMQMTFLTIMFIVSMIALIKLRRSNNPKIRKIRKFIAPPKMKIVPLFPRTRKYK